VRRQTRTCGDREEGSVLEAYCNNIDEPAKKKIT
jgi:hypothetical protein